MSQKIHCVLALKLWKQQLLEKIQEETMYIDGLT